MFCNLLAGLLIKTPIKSLLNSCIFSVSTCPLLVVLLKFDTQYWVGILTICLGHYGIDILKIYTQKQEASPKAFIVDQLAHLVLIIGVAYAYYPTSDIWFLFKSEKWLLSITSLILVSQVGAIVIRVLMSSWKLEEDSANESLKMQECILVLSSDL